MSSLVFACRWFSGCWLSEERKEMGLSEKRKWISVMDRTIVLSLANGRVMPMSSFKHKINILLILGLFLERVYVLHSPASIVSTEPTSTENKSPPMELISLFRVILHTRTSLPRKKSDNQITKSGTSFRYRNCISPVVSNVGVSYQPNEICSFTLTIFFPLSRSLMFLFCVIYSKVFIEPFFLLL